MLRLDQLTKKWQPLCKNQGVGKCYVLTIDGSSRTSSPVGTLFEAGILDAANTCHAERRMPMDVCATMMP